ncbi:MAG: phosphoglucosamine mutase [Bacteroidetes bacterium]|nr:phosphoglucosamine mutase [Bacteroidota bacterium]
MSLIKSISGIRGTIGGRPGEGLSPVDVVKFTAAYGTWLRRQHADPKQSLKVVVGRDARISGPMVSRLVCGTLSGLGIHVVDIGLSTTPTVEMAVPWENAAGGIIITASHNPKQWNALKLLNHKGEFISAADGELVLAIADADDFSFAEVNHLGQLTEAGGFIEKHIEAILALPLVDVEAIKKRNFKIAVDAVNSTGGIAVPQLLRALGVAQITELYCDPTGEFPHNPEPLPENLRDIAKTVKKNNADLGLVVDPDVDRLAIVCEDGEMFGEEYTLVAVADYVLNNQKGNTVSNLSSTRALRDVTEKAGGKYHASAVGEVNVVELMKECNAVIGGEGNGGVIYPELHYGRDALAGIALFLSHLAKFGNTCSMLRAKYPDYHISKNKIELTNEINVDQILEGIRAKYSKQPVNTVDGVKIEFDKEWVHLRRSNTEPIIRIYSESESETTADNLAKKIMQDIRDLIKVQQL